MNGSNAVNTNVCKQRPQAYLHLQVQRQWTALLQAEAGRCVIEGAAVSLLSEIDQTRTLVAKAAMDVKGPSQHHLATAAQLLGCSCPASCHSPLQPLRWPYPHLHPL